MRYTNDHVTFTD